MFLADKIKSTPYCCPIHKCKLASCTELKVDDTEYCANHVTLSFASELRKLNQRLNDIEDSIKYAPTSMTEFDKAKQRFTDLADRLGE
jgi:hypothetical protein